MNEVTRLFPDKDEFVAPPPPPSDDPISTRRRAGRPRNEERVNDPVVADLDFARRIKIARHQSPYHDLNYTEIAERLNVGKATVSAWFNGTRRPYNHMTEVARFFNVSANWLRTGQEPMRPEPPTALKLLAQEIAALPPYKAEFVGFMLRLISNENIDMARLNHIKSVIGRFLAS